MTAKEMFEELGYTQTITNYEYYESIEYSKVEDKYKTVFEFHTDNKDFYSAYHRYKEVSVGGVSITREEHLAIQKQIEELGWNE